MAFSAAGIFIWRQYNNKSEPEILMMWEDRSNLMGGQNYSRLLSFPGGRRDKLEESPVNVASRETFEELGNLLSPETLVQLNSE
mmetsp:Transcript_65456/g.55537  ORF Transcript_65456/g.55537 Transcript_65456/m.55537 type:complete len:84 (-) Transcript_65456:464-715(-)